MERLKFQAEQWFNQVQRQFRNLKIDLTAVAMTLGYPLLPTVAFAVGVAEGLRFKVAVLAPPMRVPPPLIPPVPYVPPVVPAAFG